MVLTNTDIAPMSAKEADQAIADVVAQVRRNLPVFTFAAQNHSSVDNNYPAVENNQWTSGFWPGSIWLAYEATGEKVFRYAAQIHVQTLLHRIRNRIATDHHDMGFMYSPSCVSAWRLAADKDGREAAILAAEQLSERFQEKGEFLQAWGAKGAPENYRYIIDCLMNLPLLYWASEETGDQRFRELARRHLNTSLKHSVRPDNSTYHTFFMDPDTGQPSHGATQQGYADDSNWARGQAWAIAGTAFLYRLERTNALRDVFERLLAFYLERLPSDLVPYWDLIFTEGDEPKDSSSAAIVACGLLEMEREIGGETGARYRNLAAQMLTSLASKYAVRDPAKSNGFLLHGTYSKKTPYNRCKGEGVDECVAWGDYFYFEALTRLARCWTPYW